MSPQHPRSRITTRRRVQRRRNDEGPLSLPSSPSEEKEILPASEEWIPSVRELRTPVELSQAVVQQEENENLVAEALKIAYRNPKLQNDPSILDMLKLSMYDQVKSLEEDAWMYEPTDL